ncbi:MAG: ADP-forming succinate--CoA ligase subunit beta [Gemmatimonadetes bacterium]|jgi:succinyl-CoA synthetase beta subunit|nr:ADP-forming succinate--CoA ligase subunit beta [Gemmatimonadota bacterium]MDE0962450.1 ADP-forming succinate--CoA ligase subunit beta [Candidatus Latescibacterota bacterium]MBT5325921.1 ADP-forming succinate--CoA ligase subunit beta [Gemmatimonadota bacterium]MBT5450417.1 ADP-forming succinate--CoA ligase subunit beta [Gemmatimonadota bacterium]MBT5800778.1 ADP-forming succinate--CoA ligase subunit beta [Gemmatimonadota bacterium]|tara:strand:+ start:119 stop:1276 length:1158 start_codon:yes stop_codon:yes gene_type:complete
MKIHEYQAKEILRQYNVAVPEGSVATSADEAERIATELGGKVIVKAQIHAGGRGKGGGVKLATNPTEAREAASAILGMQLITHQTGPEGQKVKQVLVEKASDIEHEFYLGITLDRAQSKLVVMASREGGVEIEEVAAETPEKILRETVDPGVGLLPFQATRIAFGLGFEGKQVRQAAGFILNLYKAFIGADCSIAEINPLVTTADGQVLALDAKINFDANALFRQPNLAELRDLDEEDELEVEASKFDLNYIKLDGNIGCMVNGAGLAMATMDIIKLSGAEPANFLDVGGGASAETVENGFRILLSDPNVKAILINIFGGIVRCDRVAEGVIQARKNIEVNVPLVVRLAGTNADVAAEMLEKSDMDFSVGHGLKDAAEKVASAIQ